jgi:hypothetical protein
MAEEHHQEEADDSRPETAEKVLCFMHSVVHICRLRLLTASAKPPLHCRSSAECHAPWRPSFSSPRIYRALENCIPENENAQASCRAWIFSCWARFFEHRLVGVYWQIVPLLGLATQLAGRLQSPSEFYDETTQRLLAALRATSLGPVSSSGAVATLRPYTVVLLFSQGIRSLMRHDRTKPLLFDFGMNMAESAAL